MSLTSTKSRWWRARVAWALVGAVLGGCASGGSGRQEPAGQAARVPAGATLAQIYFWRAKPGKLDEYTRYIREVAEPIDEQARLAGAFLSVTTYMASDTTVPWTHMRVFAVRDSAQLRGLGDALTAAGVRVQPDSVKRRQQNEYSASLRDRVGSVVVQLVR
jgi:GNAT superfamily N-acetyltransferase